MWCTISRNCCTNAAWAHNMYATSAHTARGRATSAHRARAVMTHTAGAFIHGPFNEFINKPVNLPTNIPRHQPIAHAHTKTNMSRYRGTQSMTYSFIFEGGYCINSTRKGWVPHIVNLCIGGGGVVVYWRGWSPGYIFLCIP